MELLQIIVLALIQGLSEFLPVSSSAHLILPAQLLGWPDQGLAFDVAVHVGSLIAVVGFFRRDIAAIASGWFSSLAGGPVTAESKMAWYLILGTLPAGLAGLLLDDLIGSSARSLWVIAATTIVWGVALGIADKFGARNRGFEQLAWRAVLIIGISQALALVPGTSRSGITITAALMLGFTRDVAARFSFLLSIPIILLSGGYKTVQLLQLPAVHWGDIVLGTILSAISAYFCIVMFLRIIEKMGMLPFVIYRLLLGGVLLFVASNGV